MQLLHSALRTVQSPWYCSSWQTCSIEHRVSSLGIVQPRDKDCTNYSPLSTASCTFTQLNELEQ